MIAWSMVELVMFALKSPQLELAIHHPLLGIGISWLREVRLVQLDRRGLLGQLERQVPPELESTEQLEQQGKRVKLGRPGWVQTE